MAGFSRDNAVEVLVRPSTEIAPSYGSGYRIGGRLVLTAAHLIRGKERASCAVRAKDGFGEVAAHLVWMSNTHDIALLKLPDEIEPVEAVRFGRLAREESIVAFEMYAWPQWAWTRGPQLLSGGRHIVGRTYLADRSPQKYLVIEPEPGREAGVAVSINGGSPWEGASGASIFIANRLVAVQRQHQNPRRLTSLEAEPVEHVEGDEEWKLTLRRQGIDPTLTLVGHLDAWLIDSTSVCERVRIERFVGKRWLRERVDDFIASHDAGYLLIQGRTGTGKSAFLAHLSLVRGDGCVSHFIETTPGRRGVVAALRNLTAQIINHFGISQAASRQLLADMAVTPDFFQRLLELASRQESARAKTPFICIVDGLNESAPAAGPNVLDLPAHLPPGFFVVASTQPVPIGLDVACPIEYVSLEEYEMENRLDLAAYVRAELAGVGEDTIEAIVKSAEDNWAYTFFVVEEIRDGSRDASDTNQLPKGIWKYYSQFWESWRNAVGVDRWVEKDLPLLCAATAVQEVLPICTVAEFGNSDPAYAVNLFSGQWLRFFVMKPRQVTPCIRPFNSGLVDFVHGRVNEDRLSESERALVQQLHTAVRATHGAIARRYLSLWGENLQALRDDPGLARKDDGYGWRHVVTHLIHADMSDGAMDLIRTEWIVLYPISSPLPGIWGRLDMHRRRGMSIHVPRNAWFESHLLLGNLQNFLFDLEALFSCNAERLPNRPAGPIVDKMMVLAMRQCALEVLEALPPALVANLAQHGDWSIGQILQFTNRIEAPASKARLLVHLLKLPKTEFRDTLEADVLETALEITDSAEQSRVFEELLPMLHGNRLARLRAAALENLSASNNPPSEALMAGIIGSLPLDEWERFEDLISRVRPIRRLQLLLAVLSRSESEAHNLDKRISGMVKAAIGEFSHEPEWLVRADALFQVTCLELTTRFPEVVDAPEASYERAMDAIRQALGGDILSSEAACEALARLIRLKERDDALRLAMFVLGELVQTPVIRDPRVIIAADSGVGVLSDQWAVHLIEILVDALPVSVLLKLEKRILGFRVPHSQFESFQALGTRYIDSGHPDEAIRIAREIPNEIVRHRLLARLAGRLNAQDFNRARKLVAKDWSKQFGRTWFPDSREMIKARARTLSISAPGFVRRLAELGRYEEAIELVGDIAPCRGENEWQETISSAAGALNREGCTKLLELSTKLDSLNEILYLRAHLCPFLNAEDVAQRLPAFRLIGYIGETLERTGFVRWHRSTSSFFVSERSVALDFAVSRLASLGLVKDAVSEFQRHFTEANRYVVVEMPHCIKHLAPRLRDEGEKLINLIEANHYEARATSIRYALPYIPATFAGRVLELAASNDPDFYNALCLGSQLAIHPEEQRPGLAKEALNLVENWGPDQRIQVLGFIAPYSAPARDEVLDGEIDDATRVQLFQDALWNTSGELREQWVELARGRLEDKLLFGLVNYLEEEERDRVLNAEAAVLFTDRTLEAVIPTVAESGYIETAYQRLLEISDVSTRVRTGERLMECIRSVESKRLERLCRTHLEKLVNSDRKDVYGAIVTFAPILFCLGGRDAILELELMIIRSLRWWTDFSVVKLGAI